MECQSWGWWCWGLDVLCLSCFFDGVGYSVAHGGKDGLAAGGAVFHFGGSGFPVWKSRGCMAGGCGSSYIAGFQAGNRVGVCRYERSEGSGR